MSRVLVAFIFLVIAVQPQVRAQDIGYTERARKYIDQYATLAILEQKKSGIPASITLGQGILETEAGASELMLQANNHFGIKCKNGWCGPTFTHTDDAEDECFKKYASAEESFDDHSRLLKTNPRYAPLFSIQETDYQGWARCLKKCGYATNPKYAERLIRIIEDFKLQEYTYSALDSSLMSKPEAPSLVHYKARELDSVKPMAAAIKPDSISAQATSASARPNVKPITGASPQTSSGPRKDSLARPAPIAIKEKPLPAAKPELPKPVAVLASEPEEKMLIVHGLKAIQVFKDDLPMKYAVKYHIVYQQLLAHNDLQDGPIPANMYLYLEKKSLKGENSQHIVKQGENMFLISQEEGVQLRSLLDYNLMGPGDQPVPGSVIELQKMALAKPACTSSQSTAHTRNAIVLGTEGGSSTQSGDYIQVRKTTPGLAAMPAPANKTRTVAKDTTTPSATQVNVQRQETVTQATDNLPISDASPRSQASISDTVKHIDGIKEQGSLQKVALNSNLATDSSPGSYIVKKGDTAFSIARKHNITLDQLIAWNHIDAADLKVGQTLRIKP